jgi:hypothetical protein
VARREIDVTYRRIIAVVLGAACALWAARVAAQTPAPAMQTRFRVRYVAEGAVYVEGGRAAGLSEGMELVIRPPVSAAVDDKKDAAASADADAAPQEPGVVAKLKVVSVADTSAVCEIESTARVLVVGDVAVLPQAEVEALVQKQALGNTRRYPAVVSFSQGDPLDEDQRDEVPHPPLPEVNQARGRFGFDYSSTRSAGGSSSSMGIVFRGDVTRMNGTYWNLSGYWRGTIESRSSIVQPTLQELLNRTYHLAMTYDNPNSHWVMGFGRMYLPWASSLDTIDGGYFGRKLSPNTVTGFFAGTTPDPSSWNYNLNQKIAGSFINFSGGDFDAMHYTSTFGLGITTLGWKIDRPFVFGENAISYKHFFSVYHSLQMDRPRANPGVAPVGAGLSRSFLTLQFQPTPRVTFSFNHNYFRELPTYDPQLVGTGLLDKILFQGMSVGTRVELPRHLSVYATVGKSHQSTESTNSWNIMLGAGMGQIWKTGARVDFHYAQFSSAFATGSYKSVSIMRSFGERFTGELQAGTQTFVSPLTKDTGSRFVNAHADYNFGTNYFLEGGFTLSRGAIQDYTQWYTMLGYRFDNRKKRREEARSGVQGQTAMSPNANHD